MMKQIECKVKETFKLILCVVRKQPFYIFTDTCAHGFDLIL